MKITDKTIKLVTTLSIFLSLAFIIVSLMIYLEDDGSFPAGETTSSESTSLSIDCTDDITAPPDTAEITTDSTPGSDVTAGVTAVPETFEDETTIGKTAPETTTAEETTVAETTVAETTAEETDPPVETTPETTAHTHNFSDWALYKKPTCDKLGTNRRSCSCGYEEFQPIPATGHTEKEISKVEPTCTSEGKSSGTICSVCNIVLKKQTVLPKLECKFVNSICIFCGRVDEISVTLTAPYAGLYKADGLECIYSISADTKIPQASLTKMITACVALEYMSTDEIITVGTELRLVPKISSLCYIYKGNRIKLYDLLTGMLLCSGNDAAYSVAVSVARHASGNTNMTDEEAVAYFCSLMNDYAKEIGASNTNFTTPDGSDSDNQYSTVNDLALITAHAMKNEIISEIVAIQYKKVVFASGQIAKWTNTNELLNPDSKYYTACVTGFKTGTTENAGTCLSATFEWEGEIYIALVLGCEDNDARYENILELIGIITKQ